MPTYNPAGPWAGPYPVTVTDTDTGTVWEAYGPNQLKKPTVVLEQAEDCCLYTTEVTEPLVEGEIYNAGAFAPPGKSDGDTYLVCHPNGISMHECAANAWVPVWQKIFAVGKDTITTIVEVGGVLDLTGPPAAPTTPPAVKDEGFTHIECHENALCMWVCDTGAWILGFCKEIKQCAPDPFRADADGSLTVPDCHYDQDGLVSARQVDAWLDFNLEFDSAGFTATNPCCNTVQGSFDSTVDQCSGIFQSNTSTALGVRNVINAGWQVDIDADSDYNHVSGRLHDLDNTDYNQVSGQANKLLSGGAGIQVRHSVSGFDNTIDNNLGNSTDNEVSGQRNLLDGASISHYSGRNHVADTLITLGNEVSGDGHDVDASWNSISGIRNHVYGLGANAVHGGDNEHGGFCSFTSGQNNLMNVQSFSGIIGQNNVLGVVGSVQGSSQAFGAEHIVQALASQANNRGNEVYGAYATAHGFYNDSLDTLADVWGSGTANPNSLSMAWGCSALTVGIAATTANRTAEQDYCTGDHTISGAYTAGFAFPGFGEYALNDDKIEEGLFVSFKGMDGMEIADGDDFDGISRKKLAMAAGGGERVDNLKFMYDDMGNREMEEISLEHVIPDAKQGKAIIRKETIEVEEAAGNSGKTKTVTKEVEVEDGFEIDIEEVKALEGETVLVPKLNPKWDAKKAEADEDIKMGVEMLGRTWVKTSGDVAVGDYLTSAKGVGVVSEVRTRARVLAVREQAAYVVIK